MHLLNFIEMEFIKSWVCAEMSQQTKQTTWCMGLKLSQRSELWHPSWCWLQDIWWHDAFLPEEETFDEWERPPIFISKWQIRYEQNLMYRCATELSLRNDSSIIWKIWGYLTCNIRHLHLSTSPTHPNWNNVNRLTSVGMNNYIDNKFGFGVTYFFPKFNG